MGVEQLGARGFSCEKTSEGLLAPLGLTKRSWGGLQRSENGDGRQKREGRGWEREGRRKRAEPCLAASALCVTVCRELAWAWVYVYKITHVRGHARQI